MKKVNAALLALLCAVLALLIASTSSPLYAANFWTDTNLYFTIGRGMREGLMPYRDLFDHKGPLMFLIYAVGAMISDSSFLGVFVLEALSLAAVLYLGWKTVCLYGQGKLTLLAMPILAMVTVCCKAFTQGGSAEEFCLPALAFGVYATLRRMREGENCAHPLRLHLFFGAAMGWVFLIKYTDCGLFFGLGFCLLLYEWMVSSFGRAVLAGFSMLLGLIVPSALTAGYLALHGALGDCFTVYFIQNLFDYSGTPMTFGEHIYNALAYLRTQSLANPLVAGLAMLGCALCSLGAIFKHRRGWLAQMLAAPMGAGLLLLFCYWGEMAHPYYALVFCALCPLGLIPLGTLAPQLEGGNLLLRALPLAAAAAIVPVCLSTCQAVPLMQVKKEEMPQTRFAEIMAQSEAPTLLDITSLDQGFYLAAGIVPSCRYFADNNLQTEEKLNAIAGYLEEGRTEYVVTRYKEPGPRYEKIAEASGVFDLNDRRTYSLYHRIEP